MDIAEIFPDLSHLCQESVAVLQYSASMAVAVFILLFLPPVVAVTGQMLARREEFGLVALPGGKLFAIGGSNVESDAPLKSTEIYDPSTQEWTSGPSMLTVRK